MLTGTGMPNLRTHLYQIWANIWLEYVVKNPLSPVEHPGGVGVANELFVAALERFKVGASPSRRRRPRAAADMFKKAVSIDPLAQEKK